MDVRQIDDIRIEWGGTRHRLAGPIRDYSVVGNRILIFYSLESFPQFAGRDAFTVKPLDPKDVFDPAGRSINVGGTVRAGVHLSILADTLNGFVLPSGQRVDTPGPVNNICEIEEGCVIRLDHRDARAGNILLYGHDGVKRWTIAANPFVPEITCYSNVDVMDSTCYVWNEGAKLQFAFEPSSGQILSMKRG